MLRVKPRLYQEKILATVLKGNTLVVLPTGLGKTLIAVMAGIIRSKKGKVLFLAPTKPLVEQHAKYIEEVTGGQVKPVVLHGGIPWEKRKELWNTAKWIVATPQTVEKDLLRGISLKEFALVVFDEAHRAVGNYAYVYIAKRYLEDASDPLILGLTASPGSEEEKVKEILENLAIKYVEVRTEEDEDVKPYVWEKALQWVPVELPPAYKDVVNKIRRVLRRYAEALKELGYLSTSAIDELRKTELIELQSTAAEDPDALSFIAALLKGLHALELAETQGMEAYAAFLQRLSQDRSKAARELLSQLPEPVKLLHPKMKELLRILEKHREEQVIIFANFADQVRYIVEFLRERGITARAFLGQRQGMSQKEQKKIIEEFRNGGFRVLVATSVAEEGIDLPAVKVVVFYEPVPSAIRYVQRKGRLRKGGKVYVLITKGTREYGYFRAAKLREKRMIRLLRNLRPQVKVQATLAAFSGNLERFVIVDDREVQLAKALGSYAKVKRLDIGDVVVSDRIVVERKTARDFVASIIDGRIFKQIEELKKAYERPILVVEGYDLYSHRAVHPNAIMGALASIVADWGVPVIFTRDIEETARFILALARREWESGRAPAIKTAKAKSLKDAQEVLVASLPGINLTLARRLLKKFGKPIAVFNAKINELTKVEGIGEAKARELKRVLNTPYTPERE